MISLPGFRTYVQTGIVLQVNANPVINAALALGNVEETITVAGETPLVDVRSAGISEVVEQERIVELPLQTRNVTDLIVLAGGAVNTGRVSALSTSGSVGISVAGGLRKRRRIPTRRRRTQQVRTTPGNLPFPFPGCAPGVQRRQRRFGCGDGHALGRVGQRRDQVGDQRISRQRVRILP